MGALIKSYAEAFVNKKFSYPGYGLKMLEYFNVNVKISQIAFHVFGNAGYSTVLWKCNYFLHSVNIFLLAKNLF